MSVLMRRPSTLITSLSGSAFVPSSRTVSPFTITRPSRIIVSEARRDATPAVDRIFCRRIMPGLGTWVLGLVFHDVPPELRQSPHFGGGGGPVDFGVGDEPAQQPFDARLAPEVFRQEHGLERRDDVV